MNEQLRVGFVTGSLAQGGAEKQLVYMTRALQQAGVEVQVYSLTRGEYYEPTLQTLGISVRWAGRRQGPLLRVPALAAAARPFQPHFLQSATFFTNLYAALVAPLVGGVSIGCLRSDLQHSFAENGRWGPWLVRLPSFLIANSNSAGHGLLHTTNKPCEHILVVPNVIDLEEFDRWASAPAAEPLERAAGEVIVITVARLIRAKRLERLLQALAEARSIQPALRGVIVGEGPEKGRLLALAEELGLLPHGVTFLGRRDDVPQLLRRADIFMLTSAHEGFPNALLEAMAARLPVIATPAGDSGSVVQDGQTGFIVPHEDIQLMAAYLADLANAPDARSSVGEAGRRRVEAVYNYSNLADMLLSAYRSIAAQAHNRKLSGLLERSV